MADKAKVDGAALRALGAAGVIEVGNNVQAVFGTQADGLKDEIQAALAQGSAPAGASAPVVASTPAAAVPVADMATGRLTVLSPLGGTLVPLSEVPDATFAKGVVGHGLAIDPPREVVDVVAPATGKILKLWPHAFALQTADGVGVLVHLGINTVQLKGEGFSAYAAEGDEVEIGQPILRYDVPAIEAAGRNPVVPVIILDRKADSVVLRDLAAGAEVKSLELLLTVAAPSRK